MSVRTPCCNFYVGQQVLISRPVAASMAEDCRNFLNRAPLTSAGRQFESARPRLPEPPALPACHVARRQTAKDALHVRRPERFLHDRARQYPRRSASSTYGCWRTAPTASQLRRRSRPELPALQSRPEARGHVQLRDDQPAGFAIDHPPSWHCFHRPRKKPSAKRRNSMSVGPRVTTKIPGMKQMIMGNKRLIGSAMANPMASSRRR